MKAKVLLAIGVITLLSVALIYYLGNKGVNTNKVDNANPLVTPTTENVMTSNGVTETSTITVKSEGKTERVIFHNNSGYEFTSYADGNVTDRIVVSFGGLELLQLGVNWTGNTQGSLPLLQVVSIKNSYIGNLYRATGGGVADGGYTMASLTKTSGKCSGNGDTVNAPCTDIDQIYGKTKNFTYLPFCMDLDSIARCDELMSGLEISK